MNKTALLRLISREVGMDYVLIDVRLRLPRALTLRGYRIAVSENCLATGTGRFIALTIDTHQPDYVFRNLTAVTASDLVGLQFGATLLSDGVHVEDEAYLGTIALQLEVDSLPLNLIELDVTETMLCDEDGNHIPWRLH